MKPVIINSRWELIVPDHVAEWDALQDWERCRFDSMEEHLRPGDVLYDVGTEHGELSAVYASFVGGGENMVLVEPTAQFWSNIRMTWEANDLRLPIANVHALLDERTTPGDDRSVFVKGWPSCSDGGEQPARAYSYIHDPFASAGLAHWRLDDLVRNIGVPPTAITIDTEGAETAVLKGAFEVLKSARPQVWVSIHPDLMQKNYGTSPGLLQSFMQSVGYVGTLLGVDHEEHHYFLPEEKM